MAQVNLTLAIFFALLYNITLNLSKGTQKYGIEGLSKELLKKWRERPELKRKFIFWTVGSLGTTVAVVFQLLAQPHAPNSSFVAAFGGIGLLALLIFSYYILNERIKKPEIAGALLVVAATLVFGFTAKDVPSTTVDYNKMVLLAIIPLVIMFILAIISYKNGFKGHAVIWGSIAGFFSGLGIALSQTAAIGGDRNYVGMLLTLDIWLALATGQGAFWGTQYGFKHGHATVVVTLYNTFMLIVPIMVDLIVLGYEMPSIQIAMLICIAIGVVLLTAFRESHPIEPAATPNP
jgi:multidrug transporter EmrE-like cation transporter